MKINELTAGSIVQLRGQRVTVNGISNGYIIVNGWPYRANEVEGARVTIEDWDTLRRGEGTMFGELINSQDGFIADIRTPIASCCRRIEYVHELQLMARVVGLEWPDE